MIFVFGPGPKLVASASASSSSVIGLVGRALSSSTKLSGAILHNGYSEDVKSHRV